MNQKTAKTARSICMLCIFFLSFSIGKATASLQDIPVVLQSYIENNILYVEVRNVSKKTVLLHSQNMRSIDYSIYAMASSGDKVKIKTLKPKPIRVYSGDTVENQVARITKLIDKGKDVVELLPAESFKFSFPIAEMLAPFQERLTISNDIAILQVIMPNLILGTRSQAGDFRPSIQLYKTEFLSGRFKLDENGWSEMSVKDKVSKKKDDLKPKM